MPDTQFYTAISAPRFNRYLVACGNDRRRAKKLYRANLRLSQKMYAVLSMFEIVLRNAIDRHFINIKGASWLENAVSPDGYLDAPDCKDSFNSVREAIYKLGSTCTHDRLIAKLSFGFWTYQFSKKEFAAAGSTLLEIFPNRFRGTRPKDIFKALIRINDTRNRIAHYEPVCFDKSTGSISCAPIQRRYDLIIELLSWMGYTPGKLLYGINGVQKAIDEIKNI